MADTTDTSFQDDTEEDTTQDDSGGAPPEINEGRRLRPETSDDTPPPTTDVPRDINEGRRTQDTQTTQSGGTPTSGDAPVDVNQDRRQQQAQERRETGADASVERDAQQVVEATQAPRDRARGVAQRQGGQRRVQEESTEARIAQEQGRGVTRDEVDVQISDQGIEEARISEPVRRPATRRGGQRSIQEESLEARIASQRGNAVEPGDVEATVSDTGLESAQVFEPVPSVAGRQGGRRRLQETSIRADVASTIPGVTAEGIDPNLTETGAVPTINPTGQAQLAEQRILEDNPELDSSDIRVTPTGDGLDAEFTESFRREQLREQAEEEYPNAEDIEILEDDGELVARIEQEGGVGQAARYTENFINDPVSLFEGTGDFYNDLVMDTAEFLEGRARGIENPDETADWAVRGIEEGTVEPTVDAVDYVVSDPAGAGDKALRDTAGGIVDLAEGGAEFSSGIVEGGIDVINERDVPGGQKGAALLGATVVSPVPGDEVAVGTALGGLAVGGAIVGGAKVASDRLSESRVTTFAPPGATSEIDVEEPSGSEIVAPTSPEAFRDSEITVDEDTGIVQQEVELPDRVDVNDVEITVPEGVDRDEITRGDGEIRVPIELTPIVRGRLRTEEQEEEEEDEEDDDEEDDEVEEEEEVVEPGEIVIELPEESEYQPEELLEEEELGTPRESAERNEELEDTLGRLLEVDPRERMDQRRRERELEETPGAVTGVFRSRDSREESEDLRDATRPRQEQSELEFDVSSVTGDVPLAPAFAAADADADSTGELEADAALEAGAVAQVPALQQQQVTAQIQATVQVPELTTPELPQEFTPETATPTEFVEPTATGTGVGVGPGTAPPGAELLPPLEFDGGDDPEDEFVLFGAESPYEYELGDPLDTSGVEDGLGFGGE